MTRLRLPLVLLALVALVYSGCDATGDDGGTVKLSGRVVDAANQPVGGARVVVPATEAMSRDDDVVALTDSAGIYSMTVDIDESTDVTVQASKDGHATETTVTVIGGSEREVPMLILSIPGQDEQSGGSATLTGQVVDRTGSAVTEAVVRIIEKSNTSTRTDDDGRYSLPIDINGDTDVTVQVTKDGFVEETQVTALMGETREVPLLVLPFPDEDERAPGTPANIQLVTVQPQSIGIVGSGATEVSRITYQVTDSSGAPVSLHSGAFVRFTLGQEPGGGVFIAPQQAETNSEGRVTVNLSSGTNAGTVQIVAEADVNGKTIRSNPVSVAIHGGLPDQDHFTIGPEQFNFAGLRTYGMTNPISVIVGDRYSNPVKTGTAVYFETTHGVIEGSTHTDDGGRGSVTLSSANPLPPDGVAVITASTANENQERIVVQTPVVFSGVPRVTVEPTVASLGQTYRLTLRDQNGNPLAPGTSISVTAGGTKVKATGNVDVELDDTAFIGGMGYEHIVRGPGITEFTFRAVDDLRIDESGNPVLETITILISGPNGRMEIVLTPDGAQAGQNATVMSMSTDRAVFGTSDAAVR